MTGAERPQEPVLHRAHITAEIRAIEPTPDGWAQYEATGRACVVCPCGLSTGFIDKATARDHYEAHKGEPVKQALAVDVSGALDEDLVRLLKRWLRRR